MAKTGNIPYAKERPWASAHSHGVPKLKKVAEATFLFYFGSFCIFFIIFFISIKDKIISHPDEKYIGSVLYLPAELLSNLGAMSMENDRYVRFEKYVQLESLASGLTFTAIISNQVLFRTMNTIMRYILISFLGVGGIALISAVILSGNLIYRIANLQESMEVYTENHHNFNVFIENKYLNVNN